MSFNDDNWNDSPISGENVINEQPFYARTTEIDENAVLTKVFGWMTAGLGLSAISALLAFRIFGASLFNYMVFYGLIILEFVLVLFFSSRITKMSSTTAKICFITYSIVNGVTLSVIFLAYALNLIYITFFITASMFAVAAIYGKVTKKDLSGVGTFLVMGLWGLIVGGLVNLFLHSGALDYVISFVGVIIFVGLTAYDVNTIKNLASREGSNEKIEKLAIWGALQLYLDFINLFLKLLRLFGRRKN